jgi:hypothetical protein
VCVGKIVLGARRDPRSRSDSEIQTIQDREVKQPFGGKGVCIRVVSEQNTELTSVGRRINVSTMPPRRRVDPPVANRAMEREMRELRARLDAMETTQRRAPDVGDVSEAEMEEVEVEEVVAEDACGRTLVESGCQIGCQSED